MHTHTACARLLMHPKKDSRSLRHIVVGSLSQSQLPEIGRKEWLLHDPGMYWHRSKARRHVALPYDGLGLQFCDLASLGCCKAHQSTPAECVHTPTMLSLAEWLEHLDSRLQFFPAVRFDGVFAVGKVWDSGTRLPARVLHVHIC